jgi:hypothetical protein
MILIYHRSAGNVKERGWPPVSGTEGPDADITTNPREEPMTATCYCGMNLERPGPTACLECETVTCPSCAITIETDTYCRWCAPILASAA